MTNRANLEGARQIAGHQPSRSRGARFDIPALKEKVGDRWLDLLRDLAPELEEGANNLGDQVPCPVHGCTKKFRFFDDAEETGGGVCNSCGAKPDGIEVLQWVKGWSFPATLSAIETWLDENRDFFEDLWDDEEEDRPPVTVPARHLRVVPAPNPEAVLYLENLMSRAEPGHERLRAYLRSRRLSVEPPETLGYVEEEKYFDREAGSLTLPAMIGLFADADENPVGALRTCLDPDSAGKANVAKPKKFTPAVRKGALMGAAIRLYDAGEVLCIAEGIETALAVFQATGTPTWAAGSANGVEKVIIPSSVQEVQIWCDNDSSETGQKAATKLAERLIQEGFRVKVLTPSAADTDWLDVLVEEGEEALQESLAMASFVDPTAPVVPSLETRPAEVIHSVCALRPATVDRKGDPVAELNKIHFVVSVSGKTYIATEAIDPETKWVKVDLGKSDDFALRYSNWKVKKDEKFVSATQIWKDSKDRRQYAGIGFSPGNDVSGIYNLWRGFAVEPRQGDCSLFWRHLESVICRGNETHHRYVRKWLAHMVQRPAELPGVAIVIRGAQGTGKTIFVDMIGKLVGQHYLMLTRMEQLTGKFTSHLKDSLLVCANEAVWGGDKQGEGALKALITDPQTTVEGKGKDLYPVQNYKRLIVTTNEQWAVPMAMDDRRFLVLEASDRHKEDKPYFAALARQMEDGGLQALMHDLLHEDLSGFDFRTKPRSSHGFDIQLRSAEPLVRWWFEKLHIGVSEPDLEELGGEFTDWRQEQKKEDLHQEYLDYCETHRQRTIDRPTFGKQLRKLLPGCTVGETRPTGVGGRQRCFSFPTLGECREAFQRYAKAGSEIWD